MKWFVICILICGSLFFGCNSDRQKGGSSNCDETEGTTKLEIRKNWLWCKAQELYHKEKCEEAIPYYLEFAEICENQNWTGAGDGYYYVARCYEKIQNLFNALKIYKKSKLAYEKEGQDSQANLINRILHVLNKDIQRNRKWEIQNWDEWLWLSLLKYSSDYGTNPIKLLRSIAIILLFFAFVYFPYFPSKWNSAVRFQGLVPKSGFSGVFWNFKEAFSISALIFFERSHPSAENGKTRFFVIFESLLGYFILAVFIAMLIAEILE